MKVGDLLMHVSRETGNILSMGVIEKIVPYDIGIRKDFDVKFFDLMNNRPLSYLKSTIEMHHITHTRNKEYIEIVEP